MTLEILTDFFLFISTNQKQITDNDLKLFEYFISKQFSIIDANPSLSKDLNSTATPTLVVNIYSFLSEFMFYLYNKQLIHIDSNNQYLIDSKAVDILKQKFPISNGIDSYLEQQRRNIQLQQIKNNETKRMLIKLLKENKLIFQIEPFYFVSFFNCSDKYINVIEEFIKRVKMWNDLYKEVSMKCKTHECNGSGISGGLYDKEEIVKDKKRFLEVINKMRDNNTIENETIKNKEVIVNKEDIDLQIKEHSYEDNDKGNEVNEISNSIIERNINKDNNIEGDIELNNKDVIVVSIDLKSETNNEINNENKDNSLQNKNDVSLHKSIRNEMIDLPKNNSIDNLNKSNTITPINNLITSNTINSNNTNNNINKSNTANLNNNLNTENKNSINHTKQKHKKNKRNKNNQCCIFF